MDSKYNTNIKVTGFSVQNILSTEEIVQIINLLPSYHLTNLCEINYDPHRVIPKVTNKANHKQIKGCYFQNLNMIALFEITEKIQSTHILLHEIGHHVYYRIINSSIKKKWVTQIHTQDAYVSRYSKVNASEDFAECYASYFITPLSLQRCQKKFKFFKECIFHI